MLNTDLHNPAIKKKNKMTCDQFKSNLRGVGDAGADLPAAFLEDLYRGIAAEEIKLKAGDGGKTGGFSAAIVRFLRLKLVPILGNRIGREGNATAMQQV